MKSAPLSLSLSVLVLGLWMVSCQTTQAPIPADATPEIYFQRAQAASDLSQYDEALAIYRSFLTDRPEASPEDVYSARYEVALLLLKKGKVGEAKAAFEALTSDLADLEKSAGAPGWVKVLTAKKLQEIRDKEPQSASKKN